MEKLEPDPLPLLLWVMNHWNGLMEFVYVNGEFSHVVWPAYDPHEDDPNWDQNELETASNGEDEILVVSNSEGDATEVSEEDVSDAPNTEFVDE